MRKYYLLYLFFILLSSSVFAQSALEPFGKNRIQYKVFNWKVLNTDNLDVYFYDDSYNAALLAAKYVEADFERISNTIGYVPYDKIKLIVYASNSDLNQSNLGLATESIFIGGQAVFIKSKVEVAFSGIQAVFRKDVAKSVTTWMITEMMYGGNIKDVLQSFFLLNLPDWYISGAGAYIAEGWSLEMDDQMRDLVLNNRLKKPNQLIGSNAKLIGHSIWNYIAERYGKANISNILNMTKLTRSEEKALEVVLNIPYNVFIRDWKKFYLEQANNIAENRPEIDDEKVDHIKPRKNFVTSQLALSKDGNHLCYVKNANGRYKVIVKNLITNKSSIVLRGGKRKIDQTVDFVMPLVAWKDAKTVLVIDNFKDKTKIISYTLDNSKGFIRRLNQEWFSLTRISLKHTHTRYEISEKLKQILSFDISKDGNQLVISAERAGKSDIFIHNLRTNRFSQITNDIYDDLNPSFVGSDSKKFVFSSNRDLDSLKPKQNIKQKLFQNYNIFEYSPSESLDKVTFITKNINNQTRPVSIKNNEYFYLSDKTGIKSLYKNDNLIFSYLQNINDYSISDDATKIAFKMYQNGRQKIFIQNLKDNVIDQDSILVTERQMILNERTKVDDPLYYASYQEEIKNNIEEKTPKTEVKPKLAADEIDTDFYIFESEKGGNVDDKTTFLAKSKKPDILKPKKVNDIFVTKASKYFNDFGIDKITEVPKFDNLRGLGLFSEAQLSDLLGNHKINASFFAATDFATSSMIGQYEYLKRRVDFKIKYQKEALRLASTQGTGAYQKNNLHRLEFGASYPVSAKARFSFSPFVSIYRFTNLFNAPSGVNETNTKYVGYEAEYCFDNTKSIMMNINEGTKFKTGLESHFGKIYNDPSAKKDIFHRFYLDFRHYQKIHKEWIFATRVSSGGFFGPNPKNFLLGGIDNWVGSRSQVDERDRANPLTLNGNGDNKNLLFMQYVTNLRGFPFNSFFGKNYFLFNAETRLPIFRYLYNGPIESIFFRNFQLNVFYDFGSTWTGVSPLNKDNSFNTRKIVNGNFQASVVNYKNPFLSSFGYGFRSMIYGYFFKLDYAYPIVDYKIQKPGLILSLGYDF